MLYTCLHYKYTSGFFLPIWHVRPVTFLAICLIFPLNRFIHKWMGRHFFPLLYVICVDTLSICGRYATPFGLTSEYAHPAEILFLGFATIFGPAITGPHLITLWLWMVVRVLETVEAHCGYHFPWSPSNFLPLYGGLVHA